jgi:hypothetical protein
MKNYESRIELKGGPDGYRFGLKCNISERNAALDEGIRAALDSKTQGNLTFKPRELDGAGPCSAKSASDVLWCVTPGYERLSIELEIV